MNDADVVATWNVPMSDKLYRIEFCHGTTTGKRIIRVNGKEILRREWMFKLVGREIFELNNVKCLITIEAIGIFAYEYSLQVGGKSFHKFRDQQSKALQVWRVSVGGTTSSEGAIDSELSEDELFGNMVRICLEKDSMEVWINGTKANTTGEFVDNGGTRTHFELEPLGLTCFIESESSGKRNVGIVHKLFVNGNFVNPTEDN